jgi:phage terminase small subunit
LSGLLTPKQVRFVEEYPIDLNGTKAAVRAGFSAKTARQQATRLLSNVAIQTALSERQQARAKRTEVTADRVVRELALLGLANMADYMAKTAQGDPYLDFSALTRDQAAALQEVTVEDYLDGRGEDARAVRRVKFKLHDKRAALVDLGRHFGLFRNEPAGADDSVVEDVVEVRLRILRRLARIADTQRARTGTE